MMSDDRNKAGKLIESEYEAQYFGFTPKALVDTLYNMLSEEYEEGIANFQRKLDEILPAEESRKLNPGIVELGRYNSKRFEALFNRLEDYYVESLFRIPENVVIPEDRVQVEFQDVTEIEIEEMDENISALEKRCSALAAKNRKMCEELSEINLCKRRMAETLNILRPQVVLAKSLFHKNTC